MQPDDGVGAQRGVGDLVGLPAIALLFMVGLGVIAFGWWSWQDRRDFRAGADEVAGTFVFNRKFGDDSYILTVAVPMSDGSVIEREFTLNYNYTGGRSSADPIPVLVSRADPADMRIAEAGSITPFVLGLIGLALVGLGVLGARARLRARSSLPG